MAIGCLVGYMSAFVGFCLSAAGILFTAPARVVRRLTGSVMSKALYIIGGPDGLYKIGISNDPVVRLTSLQTASPHRLRLVAATEPLYDGEALGIERECHRVLNAYWVGGEWFNAPLYLIMQIVRIVALGGVARKRWERLCRRTGFLAQHAPNMVLACSVVGEGDVRDGRWDYDTIKMAYRDRKC